MRWTSQFANRGSRGVLVMMRYPFAGNEPD